MIGGIDDPVVLAEQFFAAVTRYLTEFIVDVGYLSGLVGDRDYGRFVQRISDVFQVFGRFDNVLFRPLALRIGAVERERRSPDQESKDKNIGGSKNRYSKIVLIKTGLLSLHSDIPEQEIGRAHV